MLTVQHVPVEYVQQVWSSVEPHFLRSLHAGGSVLPGHESYGIEHARVFLTLGHWHLLRILNSSMEVVGALAIALAIHPKHKVASVALYGGRHITTKSVLGQVKGVCQALGATKLSGTVRPSVGRLLTRLGWGHKVTVFERLLPAPQCPVAPKEVQMVPTDKVADWWPWAHPYVWAALEAGGGPSDSDCYGINHVLTFLLTGQWRLVVLVRQGKILGAATVSLTNYPLHRIAFVPTIGGKGLNHPDVVEQFFALLQAHGVTKVQGYGSGAIVRLWRRLGFVEVSGLYEQIM